MILGMNYTDTATLGNYRKITISIPDHWYRQVKKFAKPGEVSRFFTEAVINKVGSLVLSKQTDPWDDFLALRDELPKFSEKEIREAIDFGRE